jgi:hypothetical protein
LAVAGTDARGVGELAVIEDEGLSQPDDVVSDLTAGAAV